MRITLGIAFLLLLGMPATGATVPDIEQGLEQVAKTLVEGLATQEVRKIAVIEFSDLGGYRSILGPFIAEELTTQLLTVKPGAFDVVERQQLAKVLAEQSLSSSALFDPKTIESVGKVLGIEAIITGTTSDLGDEVKIHARCISVATAKVFAAASTRVPKAGVVTTLMTQGAAPGPVGGSRAPGQASPLRQASDVFFQNDLLRLTVSSAGVSKDGTFVSLSLVVENLTSTSLPLAIETSYDDSAQFALVTLVDEHASELTVAEVGGIALLPWSREPRPIEYFTSISGKSRTALTLRFQKRRGSRSGDGKAVSGIVSLGLRFFTLKQGKNFRFSAGLSNIQLPANQ